MFVPFDQCSANRGVGAERTKSLSTRFSPTTKKKRERNYLCGEVRYLGLREIALLVNLHDAFSAGIVQGKEDLMYRTECMNSRRGNKHTL